jgi:kynurenine 3-monooxygenase
MNPSPKVWNIAGAGLGGSLMALYLAQKGHEVRVFERRPDPRSGKVDSGRSINLALSARGIHALRETGVLPQVMREALPMHGRRIHSEAGDVAYQPYSRNPDNCIYSVSRSGLNRILLEAADAHERVTFRFGVRSEEILPEKKSVLFSDIYTGERFEVGDGPFIACDGASSGIRYAMQKMPRFNYSQVFENYGYKELTIPPASDGGFAMNPDALHIWPRASFMLIALPNPDRSFTCTLFLGYDGETGFEGLQTPASARAFFERYFGDALALMPDFDREFAQNPIGSLVTVRCTPWVYQDWIALLGDAAHAIVPFYGQGMNAAFEDCSVLARCLEENPDTGSAFQRYQHLRKPNADAIADMALENFIEMRDRVGDPRFLFQKKAEHWLESRFPQYVSRYESVSFSRVPYTEAKRRGEVNQHILDTLTHNVLSVDELDAELALQLVGQHYAG